MKLSNPETISSSFIFWYCQMGKKLMQVPCKHIKILMISAFWGLMLRTPGGSYELVRWLFYPIIGTEEPKRSSISRLHGSIERASQMHPVPVYRCYLASFFLSHEDGDSRLLLNVGNCVPDYMASHLSKMKSPMLKSSSQCQPSI
jgi:hypothetical protein